MDKAQSVKQIFSPSSPVDEDQLFAGRKKQRKRIEDVILEKGRHAIIFGERGVGKTSLANIIRKELESKQISAIYVQASPDDKYTSLWKKVLRNIQFSIPHTMGMGINLQEGSREIILSDKYSDKITSDDILRDMQQITSSSSLVIIFDEFDKLMDEDAKKMMAHTIKLFSDSGVNVTMVVVGVASDISTLIGAHESIKRNLEEIEMPRMANDELEEILDIRFKKVDLSIVTSAKDELISLAMGLPEYIHSLGRDSALYAISTQSSEISNEDVRNAVAEFVEKSDESSRSTYEKAVSSNRESLYEDILLACTKARMDKDWRFQQKDIVEPLKSITGREIPIAGFQTHIAKFCTEERGNILEKTGKPRGYKYRFREPRLQIYTRMRGALRNKAS